MKYWREVPSWTSGNTLIWAKPVTLGDDIGSALADLDDARADYKRVKRLEKYAHRMIAGGSVSVLAICATGIVWSAVLHMLLPSLLSLAFGLAVWGYLAYGDRVAAARDLVRLAEAHYQKMMEPKS